MPLTLDPVVRASTDPVLEAAACSISTLRQSDQPTRGSLKHDHAQTYQPADLGEDDRALKKRHATMWAFGDYPAVVTDVIGELGPILVEAADDHRRAIGCSTSPPDQATSPSRRPRPGAEVIASDLTPELLATGERYAAAAGVELTWETGDAEALPYADAQFDAVLSCVGVMFAPHHQAAADELVRVCRPGGTIGLISWTPAGFIGQMFAAMKPYAPPPPPGAQPPPLWGSEEHVRTLLGDRVESLTAETRKLTVTHFAITGGVPRLLQDRLRPDDRGLQGDRGRPGQGGRPRRGAGRPRPPVRHRHRRRPCWSGSTCW